MRACVCSLTHTYESVLRRRQQSHGLELSDMYVCIHSIYTRTVCMLLFAWTFAFFICHQARLDMTCYAALCYVGGFGRLNSYKRKCIHAYIYLDKSDDGVGVGASSAQNWRKNSGRVRLCEGPSFVYLNR